MGRGQIVSGGELGRYRVKLIYAYRNRINARLDGYTQQMALLDQKITAIDAQIAAEADPVKKAKLQDSRSVMVLQRASVQKLHDYYSTKMPADPTVAAWCADATEDLADGTNVGTIEIPGEPSTVLIRPAYSNRSVYTAARDGNLMPSVAGSPYQVLFNWMLLPGWQRHKPIYRAGTIVPDSIDFDANTCSVCLDPAYSSQQSLPAVDGLTVGDCNMGDDDQSEYLTSSGENFCLRNPGHPFCTQSPGSEINITDAQLAQLRNINLLVNGAYGRANDPSGIGVGDRWDVMSPGGSGDCEDFALTKMQMLVDTYGWNPNSLNLVTAFAKNGEYHAMLGVRTRNRGLVVLDVNYDEVMESGRVPYRIDKIALASDDWRNYTRRLDNVPVEYMSCNAGAFADGDRVVVEFTSQKWTQPKVIGFVEGPKSCTKDAMMFGNDSFGGQDWSVWRYRYDTEVWEHGLIAAEVPSPYTYYGFSIREMMLSTSDGNNCFCFCGYGAAWALNYEFDPPVFYPESYHNIFLSSKYFCNAQYWVTLSEIGRPHWRGMGFRIGHNHYCVAGAKLVGESDVEATNAADKYNDTTDTSSATTDHPVAREFSMAFTINDVGYSFGGNATRVAFVPATFPHGMYSFSDATQTWSSKQSMPRGRTQAAAGAINFDGYIFNGKSDSAQSGDTSYLEDGVPTGKVWTGWVEKYSPTGDVWSSVIRIDDDYGPLNWEGIGMAECGQFGLGFLEGRGTDDSWREFNAVTISAIVKGGEPATRNADALTLQGINA